MDCKTLPLLPFLRDKKRGPEGAPTGGTVSSGENRASGKFRGQRDSPLRNLGVKKPVNGT